MITTIKGTYSDKFWRFFLKLHTYSTVVVDTALRGVKNNFLSSEAKRRFPVSRRNMMCKLKCGSEFWNIVRHSCRIDVSDFNLDSGTEYLQFEFIDPAWGWLLAARRQNPADLHWFPFAQPRGRKTYGGGIQYGNLFRQACSECPEGGQVMLMTLHWDGTYGRGLSVTPIAVGVANSNNCDKSKEFCIGYMPFTPDQQRPEFKKSTKCTRL